MPSSTSSSENAYPAPKTAYFDPEHVDRPVPDRPWRRIVLTVVVAVAVLTAGWEVYWRGKGFDAGDYKNTAGLWTQERNKAVGDKTVLIGSSRVLFGIDLDVWEEQTGTRPLQLSLEGTSPRVFLKDLAEDDLFTGTVIVGVTAPLFFGTEGGLREEVLTYRRDLSPSKVAGHRLSFIVEKYFAFFAEQTRPKRQMSIAPLPLREGMKHRFDPRKLSVATADRNTAMWERVVYDIDYQNEAKAMWELGLELYAPPPAPDGGPPPQMPDVAINAVIEQTNGYIAKIRARGGDVAFIRMPYEGAYTPAEDFGFPRERFWDRLIEETDTVGVSWHDHAELQGYELPEWSHLSASEAKRFTAAMTPILYGALEERSAP